MAPQRLLIETLPLGSGPLAPALAIARDTLCARALAAGMTLVLSDDWAELERLNLRNRDGWFPLLPKPASAPAFWIGGVDADGSVIATHGAVLVDCSAASFGARLADLSAMHDPGDAPADEWAFVASEAAHDTTGSVAWITSGWNRPDWRGRGLFHLLGAVARLVALVRWSPRWVVGLVDPETTTAWAGRCAGRARLEPRPGVLYHQNGVGRLPLHVMRWSRPAVLSDLGIPGSVNGQHVDRRQDGAPSAL
ncbi:hypothetical protein [Azospirillum rugosum]|uniref:N-acetyltransferase domain-containing protein n=1 Tax=Azospirillum rugosum TaxID=416170 RepID=A0ABS4SQ69_9PROT|nr:hypothetical protein [Azospirillum rugosum]MBP2294705.1 hypothetical protein [Azospirillum rugosum]MDQ0528006.1 hypothetical protein [Azospirillum rugosum]